MPGLMLPPLQLSFGSSATSGAQGGGSGMGTGMGAINEGNWIIQSGQGNSTTATSAPPTISGTSIGTRTPAASGSTLLLALGAALLYFVMKK